MAKKIKEPSLPKGLSTGLYNPNFLPEQVDVADFITVEVEPVGVSKIPAATLDSVPNVNGVPVPLTVEESRAISEQIDKTLARIAATKEKIGRIRGQIHEAVQPSNSVSGKEFSFTMDISHKPRIRRAIKKLFGIKTDTITYNMYLDMLKAKALLEKTEVQGYLSGEKE